MKLKIERSVNEAWGAIASSFEGDFGGWAGYPHGLQVRGSSALNLGAPEDSAAAHPGRLSFPPLSPRSQKMKHQPPEPAPPFPFSTARSAGLARTRKSFSRAVNPWWVLKKAGSWSLVYRASKSPGPSLVCLATGWVCKALKKAAKSRKSEKNSAMWRVICVYFQPSLKKFFMPWSFSKIA